MVRKKNSPKDSRAGPLSKQALNRYWVNVFHNQVQMIQLQSTKGFREKNAKGNKRGGERREAAGDQRVRDGSRRYEKKYCDLSKLGRKKVGENRRKRRSGGLESTIEEGGLSGAEEEGKQRNPARHEATALLIKDWSERCRGQESGARHNHTEQEV